MITTAAMTVSATISIQSVEPDVVLEVVLEELLLLCHQSPNPPLASRDRSNKYETDTNTPTAAIVAAALTQRIQCDVRDSRAIRIAR